jgi:cell division cycle protein 20 (cofactor of APC complex)
LDDRFIPNRSAMESGTGAIGKRLGFTATPAKEGDAKGDNADNADNADNVDPADSLETADGDDDSSKSKCEYAAALSSALNVSGPSGPSRILSFKDKAPLPKSDTPNNLKVLYSGVSTTLSRGVKVTTRHIPSAPSRILDAPDILDDYYLNLLSWSSTNILAVCLSQTVYLWNAASGDINELCTLGGEDYVSSIQWVQQGGQHISIGTSTGATQLWDVNNQKQLRSMNGHTERVGALSWNQHILSSGSRDGNIINHDVRIENHAVQTLSNHEQEVCGLSWSPDGTTLASGGNDNKLNLWDANYSTQRPAPRFTLTDHQAAVKALAWSPHERNLLATGGGTSDRCIKFWNTATGSLLNSIDTGSQVCALQWNKHEKEILSSHGFAKNQLCLWKYPTMCKVKELNGHTARVLHMAQSPDGTQVVSAAADETLRFWDVFGDASTGKKRGADGESIGSKSKKLSKTMHIR